MVLQLNCLTDCDGSCCKIKKSVRAGLKEEGYTMYRSEAHFSRALLSVLNLRVPFVQRIESGVTGSGIPDLWLRWVPAEMWAELKNDPYVSINDPYWKIKWRKGQQAWAQDYRISCGRITYTIVAMRDGFIIIPMNKNLSRRITDFYLSFFKRLYMLFITSLSSHGIFLPCSTHIHGSQPFPVITTTSFSSLS